MSVTLDKVCQPAHLASPIDLETRDNAKLDGITEEKARTISVNKLFHENYYYDFVHLIRRRR